MTLRRGPRRGSLAGLAVPDDVAVIGVHNDELLCELCDPPLTSVIPDAPRAGCVAAELLARKMKGRRLAVRLHEIAPLGWRRDNRPMWARWATQRSRVRFMRQQAAGGANVGDVLRAVPMARTALERRFKAALGTTPHAHLRKLRIERVKDLLARTSLPVGEIATATDFEHPEYLSAVFQRECGVTPREFRARFRG
jgi:LacI family transcriptional regulator